ncbi:hypothetical protein [Pedobacter sp. MC2016-24]|uniref:hypothetical protein n=1 Tax=Pedobacter sp. MC2016-24 TaxID=2780090 RepID=UPI00188045F9|nr:hypothetical protein [Pedobacter sp. MC2016-24]MBE9602654.1 hypothetical protein [Pedobacter sp. MC2016-24]
MNIEQANAIPVSEFLTKLNFYPVRSYKDGALYFSPLRREKAATFRVNKLKNVWFDHGSGRGGNFFDFAVEYLQSQKEDYTNADALRFITNIWCNDAAFLKSNKQDDLVAVGVHNLKLFSVSPISHLSLIRYLEDRGIPLDLALVYLKQAKVHNLSKKNYFNALALRNDNEGYALKSRTFKGCINGKDVTFIRGTDETQKVIHIFEGMFDFLSALKLLGITRFKEDAIILNAFECLPKVYPYVTHSRYTHLYSWFDNGVTGDEYRSILNNFISKQHGIKHVTLNKKYNDHKDANTWLLHDLKQPS